MEVLNFILRRCCKVQRLDVSEMWKDSRIEGKWSRLGDICQMLDSGELEKRMCISDIETNDRSWASRPETKDEAATDDGCRDLLVRRWASRLLKGTQARGPGGFAGFAAG